MHYFELSYYNLLSHSRPHERRVPGTALASAGAAAPLACHLTAPRGIVRREAGLHAGGSAQNVRLLRAALFTCRGKQQSFGSKESAACRRFQLRSVH